MNKKKHQKSQDKHSLKNFVVKTRSAYTNI